MDKILEFLRAWFVKVYKMTDAEVSSLFNEESFDPAAALTAISEKDKARVAQFSGKFQEGINKGKSEALKALETELMTKYGFTNDTENPLQGVALVDAIVAAKAGEQVQGEVSKLTTEDIKKLPAFQSLQREFTKQLTAAKKEAEDKISEIQLGYKKQEVRGLVGKKVLSQLATLNPVLPKVQTAAEKQRAAFLNEVLGEYDWDIQDGENFVPMKDGKVAMDEHGNALTLDVLVKQKAPEWFEFAANNGGSNGGNGGGGQQGGGGQSGAYPAGIQKPKNIEELSKILDNREIKTEDREIVLKTWEAEHANGTPV
jgi:hypothetical protein